MKCSITSTVFNEIQARTQRNRNIITRGLPEPRGSLEEQTNKDKETVENILNTLQTSNAVPKDIRRLGKFKAGSSRLLRVSFNCEKQKLTIIRKLDV